MKKVIALLSFAIVLFTACEGPQGPPGFDGFDGRDGQNGIDGQNDDIGKVFDQNVNFGDADDFTVKIDFPNTIEVFENDVVLVYRLAEIVQDSNGQDTDVWQLMPQNFFLDQGTLQYNYDHTFFDVSIFLDGTFDLTLLEDKFTQNQIFRIAVLPAEQLQGKDSNGLKFSEIESMLDTTNTDLLLF